METKKNHRDFYYFLSKKYNYRSRAAFKLIELNKKFQFLKKSCGVLDLCAAPGGWLQVARKLTQSKAIVIGIDACYIKPIKGCEIIKGDITSNGSFFVISEIKTLKKKEIDVVLHDGAPRMGISWTRDAFNQNFLALKAFKLAIQCLKIKGWFVSKIFCSENIHGFLFSLRSFFESIVIFKPKASRLASAETYVICKSLVIPVKFNSILLDPNCVLGKFVQKNFLFKRRKRFFIFKKKVFLNFLKFIRSKMIIKNLYLNLTYFNDEYFSSCGIIFFGSFVYNTNFCRKKNFSKNFFLFIIKCFKHFFF